MANLSNINGKFVVEQTTGYVGVGTTDPNFLIEAAGVNSEIALNSTSGSIYRVRSTSSDEFIITKNGVGDRLVISGDGNSTFAGKITAPILSIQNQINTTSSNLEMNYANGDGTTTNFKDFYIRDGKNAVILNIQGSSKNSTFAGEILNAMAAPKIRLKPTTQNNASILELGVLNGGTNAYARIDAINLQNFDTNLRFWTNAPGSTTQVERMRITSDGNVAIAMTPINALDSTLQVCEIGQTVVSGGDIGGKAATFAGTGGASNSSIVTIASTNTSIGAQQGGEIGFAGKFMTGSNQFAQFAKIMSYKADTVSGNYGGGLQFWTRANATPSAVKMTITDLGRVVIGNGTASANTLTLVGSAVELDIHNTSGKRWRFNADTSGNLKFEDKTGGTEAMRIASNGNVGIANTNPQAALDISSNYSIQGGVRTYAYQGIAGGTTNINLDITVGNEGGQGNVFKIEAGFAHYYAMSYNSVAEWWCTSRGTAVINTYILNAGTTLGGDWSASKPNLTTLRITKSSGTYGGTGKYWVKVTYVPF